MLSRVGAPNGFMALPVSRNAKKRESVFFVFHNRFFLLYNMWNGFHAMYTVQNKSCPAIEADICISEQDPSLPATRHRATDRSTRCSIYSLSLCQTARLLFPGISDAPWRSERNPMRCVSFWRETPPSSTDRFRLCLDRNRINPPFRTQVIIVNHKGFIERRILFLNVGKIVFQLIILIKGKPPGYFF